MWARPGGGRTIGWPLLACPANGQAVGRRMADHAVPRATEQLVAGCGVVVSVRQSRRLASFREVVADSGPWAAWLTVFF